MGRGVLRFIQDSVDPEGSILISDEYRAYEAVQPYLPHLAINHSERHSDPKVGLYRSGGHTNTIRPYPPTGDPGFGLLGLLKRAWYGQHHHYQKLFAPKTDSAGLRG